MITLSDENLSRLEAVQDKFGVAKSSQIQGLIAKYLEMDFPGAIQAAQNLQETRRLAKTGLFAQDAGGARVTV
jgi:predicted DNA-binding protein